LTVIGLGFVVARFGLFLRIMRDSPATSALGSTLIGVGLVLLGAIAVAAAAWQHARFSRNLAADQWPGSYVVTWAVWFAAALSAVGLVLAVHLLLRSSW
jgi:putative membrane protein